MTHLNLEVKIYILPNNKHIEPFSENLRLKQIDIL